MTIGDTGTTLLLRTGVTGSSDHDYNIPVNAKVELRIAPVTIPPTPPVAYTASANSLVSAIYMTTGTEFAYGGGWYLIQMRISGTGYSQHSPLDRKYINPELPD